MIRSFDSNETEQMDGPQPVTAELEKTLRELEQMNRQFGGHRYVRRFLQKRLSRGYTYRVLDVGTGGGDFPRIMVDWARANGISLVVDAIDSNPAIVELARKFSEGYPEIHFIAEDALGFMSDRFYDLVHCSLSMHHFGTAEAVEVLKHCRELSRHTVLITDLERSLPTRLGVYVLNRLLGHQPMVIRDGDTSARRAFSYREFRMLAKGAEWPEFGHERFLFCRQALWLPKS